MLLPRRKEASAPSAETISSTETAVSGRLLTLHTPGARGEEPTRELSVESIGPNPQQPRKNFDEKALAELAESIRKDGLLQPIVVAPDGAGRFVIIAGERRWRASRMAGLKTVPVVFRSSPGSKDLLDLALVENLQREDLNPIEEAEAYKKLSSEYNLSHEEIAGRIGKSRASITNAIRLLTLPDEILEALRSSRLTPGQARPLLGIPPDEAIALFKRIMDGGMSARAVEKASRKRPQKAKSINDTNNVDVNNAIDRLTKRYGRKVEITENKGKGNIKLMFYSKADLIDLVDSLLGQ